ncbi:hypothetical protein [Lysobacter gummosus]|uniref:hypothetical protein n=1 Tax=Lysobacter gummosus TaxID=262324 RepID=UPI003641D71D
MTSRKVGKSEHCSALQRNASGRTDGLASTHPESRISNPRSHLPGSSFQRILCNCS